MGIDDYAGRKIIRHKGSHRSKRWKALGIRGRKIKRMRKAVGHKRAHVVTRIGLIPAVTYGASVHGLNKAEAHQLHVHSLASMR